MDFNVNRFDQDPIFYGIVFKSFSFKKILAINYNAYAVFYICLFTLNEKYIKVKKIRIYLLI